MAAGKKLLLQFLNVINNNYKEKDLEELISALTSLLLPTIKKTGGSYLRLANYQPRDISLLAVSSIFVKDSQGRFPVLEKLFDRKILAKLIKAPEVEFQKYLKNVLLRRLKQTFYYLSSEISPERTKIKREVIYALKKSPAFKTETVRDSLYVSFQPKNQSSHPQEELSESQAERLLSLCLDNGLGGLQIPRFFKKLAEILNCHNLKFELPLQVLVKLYIETQKNYLLTEARSDLSIKENLPVFSFNENLNF
ncbi:MAG: hypothetical protein ACPLRA_03070, partial [Candidatus Saccharicenans sp.]